MAVDIESCKEVPVPCVVLYLLHRETIVVGKKADTGVPESVEFDVRQTVGVKQLIEMRCDTTLRFEYDHTLL